MSQDITHEYVRGNLYRKTELRIERIGLTNLNLTVVAAAVADALELPHAEVLVIDAREDLITLDVMRETLNPYLIVGRGQEILRRLAAIPGLTLTSQTRVASEGMLGWVALDREEGIAALDRSQAMGEKMRVAIAKRAIVFSTGPEVLSGKIADTNKPAIRDRLLREGFRVREGINLDDDIDLIVTHLNDSVYNAGFGLIITTGGVGAEAKDMSVDALLQVDPQAATPYIAHVEQGRGRHVKDGIRIGVGVAADSLLVALPGPNDEVMLALEALVKGLEDQQNKHQLAESIAAVLREKLRRNHMLYAGPYHA